METYSGLRPGGPLQVPPAALETRKHMKGIANNEGSYAHCRFVKFANLRPVLGRKSDVQRTSFGPWFDLGAVT